MLKVGFGKFSITPPLPCRLAGYSRREGLSWHVHQELWARALVLDDGQTRVGWVICDLLDVRGSFVADVRSAINATGSMTGQDVMVSATHTHAGPDLWRDWSGDLAGGLGLRESYARFLPHAVASAVATAVMDLEACSLRWGETTLRGVGAGRRAGDEQPPLRLGSLMAMAADQVKAAVVVYPCHGTVLGPENLSVSGDIIGSGTRVLEKWTGASAGCAWAQGPAGDISTRKTRRERSQEEATRLGTLVAEAALGAAACAEELEIDGCLHLSRVEVPLPTKGTGDASGPIRSAVKKRAEGDRSEEALLEEAMAARETRTGGSREVEDVAELNCLWLGKLPLCFVPGEPFLSIEQAMVQRTGLERLRVVGYANGSPGYVFGPEEEAEGGYEVLASPLTGEAGNRLVDAAATLVRLRHRS